jgi:hypothetical protein
MCARSNRLPVVREGRIVGIVMRANLMQALATLAPRDEPSARRDDRAITERILAAFDNLPWADGAFANVVVRDCVHLFGSYMAAHQDEAMILAAENVAGVKAVHSHMARVDPLSRLTVYDPDTEGWRRRGASA